MFDAVCKVVALAIFYAVARIDTESIPILIPNSADFRGFQNTAVAAACMQSAVRTSAALIE